MSTMNRFSTIATWTITVAFILGTRLSQPQAAPAEYIIDSDHFSIGFLVEHIGYAKILGMFRKAEGQFIFDEDSLLLSELNVLIHTDSVFTNHKKRDDHLRSADFLNVREFPEMTFSSTSSQRTGERTGKVNGLLTLTGKTLPMNLDVTWNKSEVYPFGHKKYTIGVSARGSFRRSSYDMNYAVANGWVGDEIQLIIELEAVQQ